MGLYRWLSILFHFWENDGYIRDPVLFDVLRTTVSTLENHPNNQQGFFLPVHHRWECVSSIAPFHSEELSLANFTGIWNQISGSITSIFGANC